jgi:hypothetical protein
MFRRVAVAATLILVALAGCSDDSFDGDGVAIICTNMGAMTVELFT